MARCSRSVVASVKVPEPIGSLSVSAHPSNRSVSGFQLHATVSLSFMSIELVRCAEASPQLPRRKYTVPHVDEMLFSTEIVLDVFLF